MAADKDEVGKYKIVRSGTVCLEIGLLIEHSRGEINAAETNMDKKM